MPQVKTPRVTAATLEKQIFEREGIYVILRCRRTTRFDPWPWKTAARDKFTLARFRDERLIPHLKASRDKLVDFIIVKEPIEEITTTGGWTLANLRQIARDAYKRIQDAA